MIDTRNRKTRFTHICENSVDLLWRLRKHPPLPLLNRVHVRSTYDDRRMMNQSFCWRLSFKKVRTYSIDPLPIIRPHFPSLFIVILYELIIYLYPFLFLTPFHWILTKKLRIVRNTIIRVLVKEFINTIETTKMKFEPWKNTFILRKEKL